LKELPSIQLLTFHKEKEMVAFRKLSPALAVAALLFGSVSAYGQGSGSPLTCQANSGVAPTVRSEGLTELLGDLVLNCTGGNPANPFLANFQIFLNTNVTSRLSSDGVTYDALLLLDEPGVARADINGVVSQANATPFCVSPNTLSNPATQAPIAGLPANPAGSTLPTCNATNATATYQQNTYNVFRGVRPNVSPDTSIVWPGVPVIPPGSNRSRVFRFTNIRGNAASIGATASGLPNQIIAFISPNPPGSVAIDNPQQTIGYVQQGLVFDVRNCNNSGGRNATTFFQCTSVSSNVFNAPTSGTLPSSTGADPNSIIGLRFREGFQTAFKIRGAVGQESSTPGQVFNTESGFVNATFTGTAGVADTGTRLMARFNNVPAGIRLFVSTANIPQASTNLSTAVLVTSDPNGAGFQNLTASFATSTLPTQVPGAVTIACPALTGYNPATPNAVEVPLSTGAGQAVWEITSADQSNLDTLFFLVGFAYSANAAQNNPGLGQSTVTGTFAPMFTASNAGTATFSPNVIPRFTAGAATAQNLFLISACSTNLLFPFVTNQAGFDTGIAIANTSQDPFSTGDANNGTCTLNYYGTLPNGAPLTTTSETTTSPVNAGQTATMVLSTGGGFGLRGNPNMQGYIIAQCNFRFAHGFAFITDGPIGQARVAEGYLAIVLDAPTTNRTGQTGENLGN